MLKFNTMIIAEHEKFQMTRRMIQNIQNDQYRFESCIFRGTNQTRTACDEKEKKVKKKKLREERLGIRVAIKIQKQFKIHIKTKLKFTDDPISLSLLRTQRRKHKESLRRNNEKRETNQEIKIFSFNIQVDLQCKRAFVNLCVFFSFAIFCSAREAGKNVRAAKIISEPINARRKEGKGSKTRQSPPENE